MASSDEGGVLVSSKEMFFLRFNVALEKFTIADFRIIIPVEVRPVNTI